MTLSLSPAEINLADPVPFERGEAFELFRILRREMPVHFNLGGRLDRDNAGGGAGPLGGDIVIKPFWNLTKYADIIAVSRSPELWSSAKGITQFAPERISPEEQVMNIDGKMLITMDPPKHVRLRRLVNKGFTPRAVGAMEDHIRQMATEILDDIAAKGECDFVLDVSSLLPLAVICGMMGAEKKDWKLIFQLTNKVLGGGDPEYQADLPAEQRGTMEAARATIMSGFAGMLQFWSALLGDRRKQRRDDLVSLLVDSEIDGQALSDEDILWFSFLLIVAGNETTRNAISGGLLALCQHRGERARLQTNMSLIDPAVEEILRWTSPVTHMARVATADTEIRGQRIGAGERIVMWYPSANRDEEVFPDPDRFDITRSPNEHLAFGIGEHFCLGAGFARLELKVIFQELFRRFPDIELAGEPERLRSTFIGGIKHLPVRYTPER
jgi:cholest-4-en-3-one 26-monooxygenase